MNEVLQLREQYGNSHVVILPNGELVPCRLLTTSEFLEYEALLKAGRYPPVCLENEIFKKCVKDKVRVDHINQLRAGVVSLVAKSIMDHSGPQQLDELDQVLNYKRAEVSNVLYDAIGVICQAFPSYTPDDLLEMDFDTLWSRLALAERKLLQTGFLEKPLEFNLAGRDKKAQRKHTPPKPPAENLANMWKSQKVPQKPKKPTKQTIITDSDIMEHHAVYTGHESEDRIILEQNMVEETAGVYKDYIEQMKRGEKVKIKSVEERQQAALQAVQRARLVRKEMAKKKAKNEEQLKLALAQKRAETKAKRRRKT